MNKLFRINPLDNVAVAVEPLKAGYSEMGVTLLDDVPFGHKVLLTDLKIGDNIIKYGNPIGHITEDKKAGSYVHDHNIKTNLSDKLTYTYSGDKPYNKSASSLTFNGYVRADGRVGTRNELWIITTVGCVGDTAYRLAELAKDKVGDDIDGVFAFTHPFGCSQLGDDQENTRKVISSLVKHPNAGGVLVLSLGCENSNAEIIKRYIGEYDSDRVKFLVTQDSEDELADGVALIEEIYNNIRNDKRTPVGIDKLCVGYKCGGSDAFSGITANALCGRVTDSLTSSGASCILTEVPEMFGAEHLLLERCESRDVFDKAVNMINGFKDYFFSHGQECYENPSPGNHDGGITTLEEKSLGCIQKGGKAVITDVLEYGDRVERSGLNLLTGPGNDIVSVTNLACAGATVIIFTTGRGTPLGSLVPTIKTSSNSALAKKKQNWIDFDAGKLINGNDFEVMTAELTDKIISVASGEQTLNEKNGYRQISIFKDGVIM